MALDTVFMSTRPFFLSSSGALLSTLFTALIGAVMATAQNLGTR